MKIKYSDIALFGLLIYLCGFYTGNKGEIICFFIFLICSLPSLSITKGNKYAKWQFFFLIYLCISYIWTHKYLLNKTIAKIEIITPIMMLYCVVFLMGFIKKQDDINKIINIFLASLGFLVLYLLVVTPVSVWGTMYLGQDIGLDKNTIGINLAWGSLFCFFYLKTKQGNTKVYILLFLAFSIICMISGSRKGLMILAFGIVAYFILYERNIKVLKNIVLAIIVAFGIWMLIMNVPVLYEQVGERMVVLLKTFNNSSAVSVSVDKSVWERSYYRNYAMKMFSEKPVYMVFGHGLDAFRTRMAEIGYEHVAYSHCNFTELLANYGIIGFLLYYFYKIKLVIKTLFMKDRPYIITLAMIILGVGIVMEYGLVSYYDNVTQFIYILAYCMIAKKSVDIEQYNKNIGESV